jgi:hypothetical protein
MAQVPTGSGCRNSRHTEPSSPRDHDPDHNYAPMTWDQHDAFGAKLPAAQDCMLMMWTPRPLVVMASSCWKWGWDPLRRPDAAAGARRARAATSWKRTVLYVAFVKAIVPSSLMLRT